MKIDSFRLFLIILLSLVVLALIIIGIIIYVKWYKKRKKKKEDLTSSRNSISEINQKTSIREPIPNIHIYMNNNNSIQKKVKREKDFFIKRNENKWLFGMLLKTCKIFFN